MSFFLFFSPILIPSDPNDDMIPTGTIFPFAGPTAPSGFVFCYGQSLDQTANASLFAVIGTIYGTGNDENSFSVPDLRGRTPVGLDDMGGIPADRVTAATASEVALAGNGGAEVYQLQGSELPSHHHFYTDATTLTAVSAQSGGDFNTFNSSGGAIQNPSTDTGEDGSHLNMPPFLLINYIIKL